MQIESKGYKETFLKAYTFRDNEIKKNKKRNKK